MNHEWASTPLDSIALSVSKTPGTFHAENLTAASAEKASELLTQNHNSYQTRFNGGFHNHIVHHILGMWSLGATPAELQELYDFNIPYQAPLRKGNGQVSVQKDLGKHETFDACLGKDECYPDFLDFFKKEITEHGVTATIRKFVLKQGDERADDIFCRMYCDLVHPIIHLGCAFEYHQPSLVAEALSAACVHDDWCAGVLLPAESYLKARPETPSKPLLVVLDSLRGDPQIAGAVKADDPFNKIRDGLLSRISGEDLAPYLAQIQVEPTTEAIERRMSEMMHTCAYVMGAAQRPGKRATIDFVLLHTVTLSVFYPAIMRGERWMTLEEKARLLEAKARWDCVMYAGCGCPELVPQRIIGYTPRYPEHKWDQLFHRANIYRDEGHVVKLIRALYSLESFAGTGSDLPIAKSDFVKIAHMACDSVEEAMEPGGQLAHKMPDFVAQKVSADVGQGGDMVVANMQRWVFYGGLEGTWNFIPNLTETSV